MGWGGRQRWSLSDCKCSFNTPTQKPAEQWKSYSVESASQKTRKCTKHCSLPSVGLQLAFTVLLRALFIFSGQKFLMWVFRIKNTEMKGWCRTLAPATPFLCQSQGHRHTVAVCADIPVWILKREHERVALRFLPSSPRHCGEEGRVQQEKTKKCSSVGGKIARTKIAPAKYLFLQKRRGLWTRWSALILCLYKIERERERERERELGSWTPASAHPG